MKPIIALAVVLAALQGSTALAEGGADRATLEGGSVAAIDDAWGNDVWGNDVWGDEVWIADPGNVARDRNRKRKKKRKK